MRLALQLVSVAVALLAAWLWARASEQPPPPNITWDGSIGQALEEWMRTSARANKRAALCTAVAVLLQAASGFWH